MITGKVIKVSEALVVADNMSEANIFDIVRVGKLGFMGEITAIHGDKASIQIYEKTAGIGYGDIVVSENMPLYAELGPGLVGNIFDGILRPLDAMYKQYGADMAKGIDGPSLDRNKKWRFIPEVESGLKVKGGDIIGTVEETPMIIHKVLVPPNIEGEIVEIYEGEFSVEEAIATIQMPNGEISELFLLQKWSVRRARPYAKRLAPAAPMITGQRIIDSFFPIAHGGTACISGSFGSGKTTVQCQIAKWSEVDVVVYISCGSRGNEISEIYREFSEIQDPRSGYSLVQRTVFIANTADMPIVSCETSIYTGITVAEYFRDMGYSVAVVVDSLSRWVEALSEISGRLADTPYDYDGGYSACLTSKLAQFYGRAGKIICLGTYERTASLTVIGTILSSSSLYSPYSSYSVSSSDGRTNSISANPIVQAALRSIRVFLSLDENLAYRRCFPALNMFDSYSLYKESIEQYFSGNINKNWARIMQDAFKLLQTEAECHESAVLSDSDRLMLETARSIREGYLMQDAFAELKSKAEAKNDLYSTVHKQYDLMRLIMEFYQKAQKILESQTSISIDKILQLSVRERIGQAKFMPNDDYKGAYGEISKAIDTELAGIIGE